MNNHINPHFLFRNSIFGILLFLIFSNGFYISAQTPDSIVHKIIEIGKTDNQTMQHLDVLCNRIGGRPIGSDAYSNAEKWAVSKFQEWGLEVFLDESKDFHEGLF